MLQQSGTPMMATDQSNLQADGPDPVPSFGGGNKSSNSGGEAAATATPAMDSLVACKRQASNRAQWQWTGYREGGRLCVWIGLG